MLFGTCEKTSTAFDVTRESVCWIGQKLCTIFLTIYFLVLAGLAFLLYFSYKLDLKAHLSIH